MKTASSELVPVRYSYPELESRQDGWGRFTHLSAIGARIMTRFNLAARERILLHFDLGGSHFEEVPASIVSAGRDLDGYCVADLRFLSKESRLDISRVLRFIL